jgi:beta-lactamase regulating signal transducer with metallopeptidase domain
MPERGLKLLDSIELDQVILHELAHVERRDLAWGWLAELSRLAYFFHPLVYWVRGRIRLERELACDQIAMRLSGETAAGYANTLLKILTESSQPAAIVLAAGSVRPAIDRRTIGGMP